MEKQTVFGKNQERWLNEMIKVMNDEAMNDER